jgi:hypothetical protein
MREINVVVCVFNSDLNLIRRKICSFFKSFDCGINVLLCCTGNQEIELKNKTSETLKNNVIKFEILRVKNSLMDIGAYYTGYYHLNRQKNLTIFMNDRFLTEFNINLFSYFLRRDLPSLISFRAPVLYGKINNYSGLIQSSAASDINYFIPTFFFVVNYQSSELIEEWFNEVKIIQNAEIERLGFILMQKYSRKIIEMSYEICVNKNSKYFWVNNHKYEVDCQLLNIKMKCVILEQLLTEIFKDRSLIFSCNDTILRKLMVRIFKRNTLFR